MQVQGIVYETAYTYMHFIEVVQSPLDRFGNVIDEDVSEAIFIIENSEKSRSDKFMGKTEIL